jgi:hypothetical protein
MVVKVKTLVRKQPTWYPYLDFKPQPIAGDESLAQSQYEARTQIRIMDLPAGFH